jgi:hypothetical protein
MSDSLCNQITQILNNIETAFYNIDSGLIQHPDLVQFAHTLEQSKKAINKITDIQIINQQPTTQYNYVNLDMVNPHQMEALRIEKHQ